MKRENQLILELCRFLEPDGARLRELLDGPLDGPYVLGQLLYHRVGGVAYHTLAACGLLDRLHRDCRNALRAIHQAGVQQTESLGQTLVELGGTLEDAPFPYAVLKGAYLARLYPPGLRTSNDIDLLIGGADISALAERLEAAGYRQGYLRAGVFTPATRTQIIAARMNRGETVPFLKRVDRPGMAYSEIDVNFSLDYKAVQETGAVAALLARRRRLPDNGLYTLDAADFLLHLCVHLYKEAAIYNWVAAGRDQSLYKYTDIYLYLRRFLDAALAARLRAGIAENGLERPGYYALCHTAALFGLKGTVLDGLLAAIRPADDGYLREVLHPASGRIDRYDMSIDEWIFQPNRKEQLYAVTDAPAPV